MKSENPNEDITQIEKALHSISTITLTRDISRADQTRSAYLHEIQSLSVSKPDKSRLTFQNLISNFFDSGKENFRMSPALISLILATMVFFGGGSLGIVSAQNSLPDDWLYPIKLVTEDIHLAFTKGTEEKLDLEMDLSENRVEEIVQLLNNNSIPDENQFERLDNHLMAAFKLAMETNTQNAGEMIKLQTRLQEQARLIEKITIGENPSVNASLIRTRNMLTTQTKFVEDYISALNSQNAGQSIQNNEGGQSVDQSSNEEDISNPSTEQDQDQIMDQDQNQTKDQDRDRIMDQDQDRTMDQDQIRTMESNGNLNMSTPIPSLDRGQNSNTNSGNSGGGGKGNR